MVAEVTRAEFIPAELPARFEAGTPAIAGVIALAAALDYLEKVGLEAIHEHTRVLAKLAHRLLTGIPNVRMLGPSPEFKTGIVSFLLDGIHAHDLAHLLNQHGIAVRAGQHCAMPLHQRLGVPASTRASFYLYNTTSEVEELAAALKEAAAFFNRRSRSPS
jgi:cysteine desulfurase/selenocysteine lyase